MCIFNRRCADTRGRLTAEEHRPLATNLARRCGSRHGTSVSTCSAYTTTFHHTTASHHHFMYHSSNHTLNPCCLPPQNLVTMRYLLFQNLQTRKPSTGSGPSSIHGGGTPGWNTLSTGRTKVLSSAPGSLVMTSLIQCFSHNTTQNTQIAQLPGVEVGPVVVIPSGHQELPVEEGVLSQSHNHHKQHTIQHTTHCHQISTLNPLLHSPRSSDHLLLSNSTHYMKTLPMHSLVWSRSYEHY